MFKFSLDIRNNCLMVRVLKCPYRLTREVVGVTATGGLYEQIRQTSAWFKVGQDGT